MDAAGSERNPLSSPHTTRAESPKDAGSPSAGFQLDSDEERAPSHSGGTSSETDDAPERERFHELQRAVTEAEEHIYAKYLPKEFNQREIAARVAATAALAGHWALLSHLVSARREPTNDGGILSELPTDDEVAKALDFLATSEEFSTFLCEAFFDPMANDVGSNAARVPQPFAPVRTPSKRAGNFSERDATKSPKPVETEAAFDRLGDVTGMDATAAAEGVAAAGEDARGGGGE